ncbi:MAG: response regulator, partial [Chloroflexota bacterium]|nr:response regulator [Chloroflexota bacterium]
MGRPSVLVVDDSLAARDVLGSWLVQEGFQVMTADTGAEAVRLAVQQPPGAMEWCYPSRAPSGAYSLIWRATPGESSSPRSCCVNAGGRPT